MNRTAVRPLILSLALMGMVAAPSAMASAPGAPTHFTRNPALLQAKEKQLVDGMRAQNPRGAAALQQLFSQDILAMLQPGFQRVGLDSSDIVDMMAAYWINAWEAVHGIVGRETDPAVVRGAQAQLAAGTARMPNLAQMTDAQKQEVADTMLLQTVLISARMQAAQQQGPAAVRQMGETIAAEAKQFTSVDMRQMTLTAEGFKPVAPAPGAPGGGGAPAPAPAPGGPPHRADPAPAPAGFGGGGMATGSHPENWIGVEGVYFRAIFTFGVGGMMIQDFQPVILFRDGSYYKVEGPALEDMDLAASKASKPQRWGNWQRTAAGYALSNDRGQPGQPVALQQGRFFRAFPAEANGGRLTLSYRRVSGGGNMSLGGDTIYGSQTDIAFSADGTFGRRGGGGGFTNGQWTNGAQVAVSGGNAGMGRYQISKYTITMTQPDGSVKRSFFAFGSQRSPAVLDADMLFIGGNVFSVRRSS